MKAAESERESLSRHRLWCHAPGLLESQLTEYFSQFGTILDVYIPRDRHNGARKNFGFATFEDEEGLRRTLAAGSEHIISGKVVRVNLAGPRPEAPLVYAPPAYPQQPRPPPSGLQPGPGVRGAEGAAGVGAGGAGAPRGSGPRIYVGGIPTAVSETMVRNHFTQWGAVTDVYFPKDRFLNRRKNFCFVTFATQQAAEKAAAQSDREINGYRIESISITHDRQEHYQRQGVTQPAQVSPAAAFGMPPGGGAPLSMPIESSMRWMGSSPRAIQGSSPASGSSMGRSPVAPSPLNPMRMQAGSGGAPGILGSDWAPAAAAAQQQQQQPAAAAAYRGLQQYPGLLQQQPPPAQQQSYGSLSADSSQLTPEGGSPEAAGAPAGGYAAIDMMFGMGGGAAGGGGGGLEEEQQLAAQMAQYNAYMQQYAAALYLSGQQQQQQQQQAVGAGARGLAAGGPLMSMGMVAAALPEYSAAMLRSAFGGEGAGQEGAPGLPSTGSGVGLEGAGSSHSDLAPAAQPGTSASSGRSLQEAAEASEGAHSQQQLPPQARQF